MDINPLGAAELERRGISTRVIRLGYVPEWDTWGGARISERPIDFTFLGGYNERRARVLARCGPSLKDRRSAIHVVDTARPHTVDSDKFLSGERKWRHLASSKVILNVHRDERPYFEWERVLSAAANGCVVVTEHSLETDPLVPGEHFISATPESLPHAVGALLEDEERLAHMRRPRTTSCARSFRCRLRFGPRRGDRSGRPEAGAHGWRARTAASPFHFRPTRRARTLLGAPAHATHETDVMRMALKRLDRRTGRPPAPGAATRAARAPRRRTS